MCLSLTRRLTYQIKRDTGQYPGGDRLNAPLVQHAQLTALLRFAGDDAARVLADGREGGEVFSEEEENKIQIPGKRWLC